VKAAIGGFLLLAAVAGRGAAQGTSPLDAERRSYGEWLATSSTSPLAAVAMHRLTGPVTLGPDTADIPLAGFDPATVVNQDGKVTLRGSDGRSRPLSRERPNVVAPWTLQVLGSGGNSVLLVYGKAQGTPPGWYPVAPGLSYTVTLAPAARLERRRVLTLDGIEVEAEAAGYVSVPLASGAIRLLVMRMPVPGTEESELQVYFRDQTNDHGSYPAGRFVELVPGTAGTYRLDFNRARNPFCAYSSVYPCPVPWSGNSIPARIEAGEKYRPHPPGS